PQFDHPVQLLYYVGAGDRRRFRRPAVCPGLLCHRVDDQAIARAGDAQALAGVLVGVVGLAFPESLATGYGWLQWRWA
ncbi:MAG TPA: hypothetical protein VHE80_01875, partial [Acidimicrobiales bacterium]|nr:hypothetical protein [Acidimicrobiales bacterium]